MYNVPLTFKQRYQNWLADVALVCYHWPVFEVVLGIALISVLLYATSGVYICN